LSPLSGSNCGWVIGRYDGQLSGQLPLPMSPPAVVQSPHEATGKAKAEARITEEPRHEIENGSALFISPSGAGDWNLLSPSHDTYGIVDVDGDDAISSAEIFDYLENVRSDAEQGFETTMSKYDRSTFCVKRGLENFSKNFVSEKEYHELVQWMYDHCTGETADKSAVIEKPATPKNVTTENPVLTFMSKKEFYLKIKNHFINARDQMAGDAEAVSLRASISAAKAEKWNSTISKKLRDCITEASNHIGKYTQYELQHHFDNAVQWITQVCMA
jgi:hypothetical protein